MPEFLKLTSPKEALNIVFNELPIKEPVTELIATTQCLDRIIGKDVISQHPLPEFPRASVDGYAVKSHETFGASESIPGYLIVEGEIQMGGRPPFNITSGTCALIHTGGMIPDGADAVVMLEYTQIVDSPIGISGKTTGTNTPQKIIEITRSVAKGENIIQIGEDIKKGQSILKKGSRVRAMEIGGCMAQGIMQLRVAIKPKIGIISTGNEVIPPTKIPVPGQVRDVNSYSLAAIVSKAGGIPVIYGIVPDQIEEIFVSTKKAMADCDVVIITAGSSASSRDLTAEAINLLGKPGVLVHGINVRPGKPTILGVCKGKPILGLPGNPVSALIIANLILVPIIESLLGYHPAIKPSVNAELTLNIPSEAGREDWVAVTLMKSDKNTPPLSEASYLATPLFIKSNLIFSLTFANGIVKIPADNTGISAGDIVQVELF
jgi:molybdopterin molybdotransferase